MASIATLRSFFLVIGLTVVSRAWAQSQVPCDVQYPNDGGDSFICRCNSTYCDTFPSVVAPDVGAVLWVQSDISNARFLQSEKLFIADDGRLPDYELSDITGQSILGFGAAITDSAAVNVLKMSSDTQEAMLRSYYSSDGLEYNMNRINIAGCDFSTRGYTYVDTVGDVALDTFSLQVEDTDYKIPLIKRASEMATSPLLNLAAAWSAPAWMKSSNDIVGYGHLLEEYYQPWAEYHVKFLDAYAAHNISIWGMSAQNEPLDGNIPLFPFNCMGWTAETQRKFIAENLGPLLHDRGYEDLHLMLMDDQRINLPHWPETAFNDSAVDLYSDGIAVHWYMDELSTDRLDATHELFPNKFILNTEACIDAGLLGEAVVVLGSWERLERYARDIIEDLEHWVVGWVEWNIVLDEQGGPNWCNNFVDAPIIMNEERDEFYKNPMYYSLGHFSKFIRRGAVHLQTNTNSEIGLRLTTFRNTDGSTAVVILNDQDTAVEMSLSVPDRGLLVTSVDARSINSVLFT